MAETQIVTVPGIGDLEFPVTMSDDQIRAVIKRKLPELRREQVGTLPVEAGPFQARARAEMLGENAGAAAFLSGTAAGARMLPGVVGQMAAPGIGGTVAAQMGLSGIGEAAGQYIESPVTGAQGPDYPQIGIATAMPAAFRAAGRVVTGLPDAGAAIKRTGQRLIPGMFKAGQEGAQAAVKGQIGEFAQEAAGQAGKWAAVRASGTEAVEAGHLRQMATEVADRLVGNPVSQETQTAKKAADLVLQLTGADEGGTMSLKSFESLRRELNALWRETAPRNAGGQIIGEGSAYIRTLQKGLYEALENAAAKDPGAMNLQEALRLTKLGMGADKFERLVQNAMVAFPQGGPSTGQALNVPKLIKAVNQQRRELTSLLGEAGMAKLDAVLDKARTVPPKMAYNLVNVAGQSLASAIPAAMGAMVGLSSGTGGAAVGIAAGALAGVGMKELLQNWISVTKTPESVKQFLNLTALGANALRARATRQP